jgi:hypothetical protein
MYALTPTFELELKLSSFKRIIVGLESDKRREEEESEGVGKTLALMIYYVQLKPIS